MNPTNEFPQMIELVQRFPNAPELNFHDVISTQFKKQKLNQKITLGMRIGIGVGSRGISNLREIVKATIDVLLTAGASPFIIPAMGSHGGATPEGQMKVLAEYGVTSEIMGVPIDGNMEVKSIGRTGEGRDVVLGVSAIGADAIIVLNRVKPHTDFRGIIGSGLQKMLVIGFGKQIGARNAHQAAAHLGHELVIRQFAEVILQTTPILCGIAIIENQRHQTAEIKVVSPDNLPDEEGKLFAQADASLARLPFNYIDLLIVDEIGKEFSGAGMDTNVIGRDICGYNTSLTWGKGLRPRISRIVVRSLSEATNGNGAGIGMADFTTTRAVQALDLKSTYLNAITAMSLQCAKIPIHFDTDREVLRHAISSLATFSLDELKVVRISNTLDLERFDVSVPCLDALDQCSNVEVIGSPKQLDFDEFGNLNPMVFSS